jgi:hypothetical protein
VGMRGGHLPLFLWKGGGGVAGEGWLADTRIRCNHVCSLARRVAD